LDAAVANDAAWAVAVGCFRRLSRRSILPCRGKLLPTQTLSQ
jgi:hypothetical protein